MKSQGRRALFTVEKGPTGPIGSPTDIARFIMAYLNDGELDGQHILSEDLVAALTNQGHIPREYA